MLSSSSFLFSPILLSLPHLVCLQSTERSFSLGIILCVFCSALKKWFSIFSFLHCVWRWGVKESSFMVKLFSALYFKNWVLITWEKWFSFLLYLIHHNQPRKRFAMENTENCECQLSFAMANDESSSLFFLKKKIKNTSLSCLKNNGVAYLRYTSLRLCPLDANTQITKKKKDLNLKKRKATLLFGWRG